MAEQQPPEDGQRSAGQVSCRHQRQVWDFQKVTTSFPLLLLWFRESLQDVLVVVKSLGMGFHLPVDGIRSLSLVDCHRRGGGRRHTHFLSVLTCCCCHL